MPPRPHRCELTHVSMFGEEPDRQVACRKSALSADKQEGNQGARSERVPESMCTPSRRVGAMPLRLLWRTPAAPGTQTPIPGMHQPSRIKEAHFQERELTTCVESMKLTQIKIPINIPRSQKEPRVFPKVAEAQPGVFYDEADRALCFCAGTASTRS